MNGALLSNLLIAALALALVFAAFTDLRARIIENWLNAGIALAAPLYWWTCGYALWPDVAIQIGIALVVFAIFAGVFALGAMGGGDVKLLGALALWLPLQPLMFMLVVMALVGGVLTVVFAVRHKLRQAEGPPEIPYGVAIAVGGLWVVAQPYFNHFA